MIQRKLLKISSDDRDDLKQSTSDFTVSFSNTTLQNVKGIALKTFTSRHLIDNINSNNNTLEIYVGLSPGEDISDGSAYVSNLDYVTIPVGQYSATELAQEIETQLNTQLAPDVFSCILTADDYFEISCSTTSIAILETESNEFGRLLGFSGDINIAAATLTAQSKPQLSIPEIYLHSSLSSNHCIDSRGYLSDVFTVINLNDAPYGGILSYSSPDINSDLVTYDNKRDISSVSINIRDNKGKLLDLDNNELNLLFEVFY
jgi:hypothetical protein